MNIWVTAAVRFAAVAPDDDNDAEVWADGIADRITKAVDDLDYSIEEGSARVVDWTVERV